MNCKCIELTLSETSLNTIRYQTNMVLSTLIQKDWAPDRGRLGQRRSLRCMPSQEAVCALRKGIYRIKEGPCISFSVLLAKQFAALLVAQIALIYGSVRKFSPVRSKRQCPILLVLCASCSRNLREFFLCASCSRNLRDFILCASCSRNLREFILCASCSRNLT